MRSSITLVLAVTLVACLPGLQSATSKNSAETSATSTRVETTKASARPKLGRAEFIMDWKTRAELPLSVSAELDVAGVHEPSDVQLVDHGPDGNSHVGKTRRNGAGYFATVSLSTEGVHELAVMVKGQALRTRKVLVSKVPGIGGSVVRLALPNAYAVTKTERSKPVERNLFVPTWRSADIEAPAYRAEWRGASTPAAISGRMQRDLLRSTLDGPMLGEGRLEKRAAWHLDHVKVPIPEEVIAHPGKWQLVVDVEQRPTQTVTLEVGVGGEITGSAREERHGMYVDLDAVESAADPAVQKELAKIPEETSSTARSRTPSYAVSAEELRALTRSSELFELRKEMSKLRASEHYDSAPTLARKDGETHAEWERRQGDKDQQWKRGNAARDQKLYQKQATLWPQMQRLIAKFGGPWTDEEIPYR